MLAAEYLSCEAGVYDMVVLDAMQLRKTAQQVSNGDCVLACRKSSINRICPFLRSPSPKRSFAFGHLAQKEKQNVLPAIRDDSRIVECVVEGPNQPVESRSEVQGSPIAIEPVRFRILSKHVPFN
jgi:hypothetical protein